MSFFEFTREVFRRYGLEELLDKYVNLWKAVMEIYMTGYTTGRNSCWDECLEGGD